MTIAAAQTVPNGNDILANIADHCRLVAIAAVNGAGLIVFPELSLTGYEREQGDTLAFTRDDERLKPLQILS